MTRECNAKINKKNDIAGKNYHRCTNEKSTNSPKTCYIEKNAYLCSRFRKVKAVCKKSIAIRSLHLKFAIFYEEGRASMLSLDVYAIGSCLGISTGVRYVRIPHFLKGVWRYLNVDGHEYISLMPFFIVLTPVGDLGQKYRNAMQGDDYINFESMPELSTHEQKDNVPIVEREYFSLYDELEEKCHPDRYLNPFNPERFALANELYAELQRRSRRDDNSLIDIREKAIDGLGIHISTRRLYEYLLKYCDPKIYTSMQPYDKARVQEAGRLFAKIQAAKDDIHELEEVWREAETFILSREDEIDMKLAEEVNSRIVKQMEIDKEADKKMLAGIGIIIAGVILLLIFG